MRSVQQPADDTDGRHCTTWHPGTPGGWAAHVAGVVWAAREAGYPVSGAGRPGRRPGAARQRALVVARAGVRGGHGRSTRCTAPAWSPTSWRSSRCVAENDFVGAPTGMMDQIASLRATAGHALFLDNRSLDVEQVPLDPAPAGLRLLVLNTRVHHGNADGAYGDRRAACERAARLLGVAALRDVAPEDLDDALARASATSCTRRVRHVVTEDARVLDAVTALRAGDWSRLGALMDASHESLRDRLRGQLRGAGRCRGRGPCRRRAGCPDDRRRVRRLARSRWCPSPAWARWARRSSPPLPAVAGPPRTSSRSRPRRAPVATPDRSAQRPPRLSGKRPTWYDLCMAFPRSHRPGSDGERALQAQLGSTDRADRFYDDQVLDHLNPLMRSFVRRQRMFFLATADASGACDNTLRAGPPGFLSVLDSRTVAWPEFRGNGVMASMGNIAREPAGGAAAGRLRRGHRGPARQRAGGTGGRRHDGQGRRAGRLPGRAGRPGSGCGSRSRRPTSTAPSTSRGSPRHRPTRTRPYAGPAPSTTSVPPPACRRDDEAAS